MIHWGNESIIHNYKREISCLSFSICTTTHQRKMQSSLIICFLITALVAVSISRPPDMDRTPTMVQTFITRIEKIMDEHFKFSQEIGFGPRNDIPIDGLTSALDHLRKQLRPEVPPTQHLQQVQMDLKTLLTTLEKLAISQRCPLPNPEPPAYKDETTFSVTFNYLYLQELHWYLEKLCLYMDKLKWCKDTDVAGLCC